MGILILKRFVLVWAIAVAAGAMAAAEASAVTHAVTSPEASTAFTTGTATTNQVLKIWNGETVCKKATFTATVADLAEDVTAHPEYAECEVTKPVKTAATVDTTGCDFTLTGTTSAGGDAPVHINCTGGNLIKITTRSLGCTISVGDVSTPTGGGVSYANGTAEGKGDITVKATITGIHYTSNFTCQLAGLTKTDDDGVYEGSTTVRGYSDAAHTNRVGIGYH